MTAVDAAGQDIAAIPAIPCTYTGGKTEFRAEAEFPHGLGRFVQTCRRGGGLVGPLNLTLKFDSWKGHALSRLPLFERLAAVFCGRGTGHRLRYDFSAPGARLFTMTLDASADEIDRIGDWLDEIGRAREVCRRLDIDPVLPADYSTQDAADIDYLYDLVIGGERTEDGDHQVVRATAARDQIERLLTDPTGRWTNACFRGPATMGFDFLRQKLTFEIEL